MRRFRSRLRSQHFRRTLPGSSQPWGVIFLIVLFPRFGDIHIAAGVHGNPIRLVELGGATGSVGAAGCIQGARERGDDPGRRDLLDLIVARVGDVCIAAGVHRHTGRPEEGTCVLRAAGGHVSGDCRNRASRGKSCGSYCCLYPRSYALPLASSAIPVGNRSEPRPFVRIAVGVKGAGEGGDDAAVLSQIEQFIAVGMKSRRRRSPPLPPGRRTGPRSAIPSALPRLR